MQKLLVIFIVLGIILAGCGGGGSPAPSGNITGKIIDQMNQGVPGVTINIGSYQTVTSNIGEFSFSSIPPGTYQVSGSGGSGGHYIFAPFSLQIVDGTNNLGNIKAYKILGCGVIIQSLTSEVSGSLVDHKKNIDPGMKMVSLDQIPHNQTNRYMSTRNVSAKAATTTLLNESISFILLSWGGVGGNLECSPL